MRGAIAAGAARLARVARAASGARVVRVAGESMAPTYRPADLLLTAPVGRAALVGRARSVGAGSVEAGSVEAGSVRAESGRAGWGSRGTAGGRRRGRSAGRGDVVVLQHDGVRLLKRLVAGPGDVVELEAGRLSVNGRPVDGRPRVRGAATRRWCVPEDHWFVAGDNAAASDDSRVWRDPFVADADVLAAVVGRLPATPRRRAPAAPPAA